MLSPESPAHSLGRNYVPAAVPRPVHFWKLDSPRQHGRGVVSSFRRSSTSTRPSLANITSDAMLIGHTSVEKTLAGHVCKRAHATVLLRLAGCGGGALSVAKQLLFPFEVNLAEI